MSDQNQRQLALHVREAISKVGGGGCSHVGQCCGPPVAPAQAKPVVASAFSEQPPAAHVQAAIAAAQAKPAGPASGPERQPTTHVQAAIGGLQRTAAGAGRVASYAAGAAQARTLPSANTVIQLNPAHNWKLVQCYTTGRANEVEKAAAKAGYSGKRIRKAILKALESFKFKGKAVIPGHCSSSGDQDSGTQPDTLPGVKAAATHILRWLQNNPANTSTSTSNYPRRTAEKKKKKKVNVEIPKVTRKKFQESKPANTVDYDPREEYIAPWHGGRSAW